MTERPGWQRISSRVERVARLIPWAHHRALQAVGSRPIPLGYWEWVRRSFGHLAPFADPLVPPYSKFVSDARQRHPALTPLLHGYRLSPWSLHSSALSLLWQTLWRERPNAVIECGAGASTMLLAEYARHCHESGREPVRIVTLEQDIEIQREIQRRLGGFGGDAHVVVLHAPLTADGRYDVPRAHLEAALDGRVADMLLIDGPAGPDGCRRWTLPLLAPYCRPGAHWLLDDAFRDGELAALSEWDVHADVAVDGIYPVGKGLAVGRIAEGDSTYPQTSAIMPDC